MPNVTFSNIELVLLPLFQADVTELFLDFLMNELEFQAELSRLFISPRASARDDGAGIHEI